jgi:hypothetical protein
VVGPRCEYSQPILRSARSALRWIGESLSVSCLSVSVVRPFVFEVCLFFQFPHSQGRLPKSEVIRCVSVRLNA